MQNEREEGGTAEPRRVRDRRRASIITGTSVDVDSLAGDEPAAIADQEQAARGDLVDLPLPPERDAGSVRRTVAIPFGIVAPGVDAARRDDIYPDVVRREFRGEPAPNRPAPSWLLRGQPGESAQAPARASPGGAAGYLARDRRPASLDRSGLGEFLAVEAPDEALHVAGEM